MSKLVNIGLLAHVSQPESQTIAACGELYRRFVWPQESLNIAWQVDTLDSFPEPRIGRAPVMVFETSRELCFQVDLETNLELCRGLLHPIKFNKQGLLLFCS